MMGVSQLSLNEPICLSIWGSESPDPMKFGCGWRGDIIAICMGTGSEHSSKETTSLLCFLLILRSMWMAESYANGPQLPFPLSHQYSDSPGDVPVLRARSSKYNCSGSQKRAEGSAFPISSCVLMSLSLSLVTHQQNLHCKLFCPLINFFEPF